MDLDRAFIHSFLVTENAHLKCLEKGFDAEKHLNAEGRKAWEFILKHKDMYGAWPSLGMTNGHTNIDFSSAPTDPFEAILGNVFERKLNWEIRDGLEAVTKKISALDPQGAAEAWGEIHRKLLNEKLSSKKIENLFEYAEEVIQAYQDAKAGKIGIPTPWPTMDVQTMGWQAEDLVLFVARLGFGKTFTLLKTSHVAWENKANVLIATTEMRARNMAMRIFAMHFRISYGDLRRGRLGEHVEQAFFKQARGLIKEKGLSIIGGGFDFTIDNLELAVDQHRPNVLSVDGAYLIKNKGKDRNEKVANNFDDLKRIAKKYQIACIANTQFNRADKKESSETISAENIGMTDVAGWNSDAIYGLWRDEIMEAEGYTGIKAIKVREGKPVDFKIRWDMDRMDFSEVLDDQPIQAFQAEFKSAPMPDKMKEYSLESNPDDLPF